LKIHPENLERCVMNPNISRTRRRKAWQSANGGQECRDRNVNVSDAERWASLFAGGFLTACGLLRGTTSGLALAAIGGALAYRGVTGHCQLYEVLGESSADHQPVVVEQNGL
jgi:uncharacterized membrane protein